MKIIFAGTPEFAATSLAALIDSRYEIVAVLTQPDRAVGRGRNLTPSAVKQLAIKHDIAVYQPHSLKNKAAQDLIKTCAADVMIVAAYGLILPEEILAIPKYGCLNIHASLLPRWRGAAPIQRAIEAGDRQTGITIMQMDAGLDTGKILAKKAIDILERDTTGSLHDKLAVLGAELITSILKKLPCRELQGQEQNHSLATYAHKLTRQETKIDWNASASVIVNRIHAFNPWPGARTSHGEVELKILQAKVVDQKNTTRQVGEILVQDKSVLVRATDGWVKLLELQKPGGRPMAVEAFLNGYALKSGDQFS